MPLCPGSTYLRPCFLLSCAPCSPRLTTCHSASMTSLSLTPRHPRACKKGKRAQTPPPSVTSSGHSFVLEYCLPPLPPTPLSIFLLLSSANSYLWPCSTTLATSHLCCIELLLLSGRFQAFCEFLPTQGSQERGRKGLM